MIKNIEKKNIDDLKNFFENAVTSDDHRHDSFSQIVNNLIIDEYYRGFAKFDNDGKILSACFMRELVEQKAQILDRIVSRKSISIYKNCVGEVVDHAIRFGEQKGIHRFYTFLTDDMLNTVDVLKKKNLVFTWRERYDTYVDEIIESKYFSTYYLHWLYIMNSTVRDHRKIIRHHHLKPEYYDNITES